MQSTLSGYMLRCLQCCCLSLHCFTVQHTHLRPPRSQDWIPSSLTVCRACTFSSQVLLHLPAVQRPVCRWTGDSTELPMMHVGAQRWHPVQGAKVLPYAAWDSLQARDTWELDGRWMLLLAFVLICVCVSFDIYMPLWPERKTHIHAHDNNNALNFVNIVNITEIKATVLGIGAVVHLGTRGRDWVPSFWKSLSGKSLSPFHICAV